MTELLPRHRYTEYNGFRHAAPGGLLDDAPAGAPARAPEAVGLSVAVPPLRRTAAGAIDYDFYLRRARAERSRAGLALVAALGRRLAALFAALAGRGRGRRPLHHI